MPHFESGLQVLYLVVQALKSLLKWCICETRVCLRNDWLQSGIQMVFFALAFCLATWKTDPDFKHLLFTFIILMAYWDCKAHSHRVQ